jgi:hypothetical protein
MQPTLTADEEKMPTQSPLKHTPGPWQLSRNQRNTKARISGKEWEWFARIWVSIDGEPSPEGEANARLIAAAPDMLAALQMAADTIHSYHGDQTSHDGWQNEEVRDVWLAARAAVRKATGA